MEPIELNHVYFIPQEEMEDEFPYEEKPARYYGGYSCECGNCLSCVGLSETDFM